MERDFVMRVICSFLFRCGLLIGVLCLCPASSFAQEQSDQVQQLYEQAKADEAAGRVNAAISKYREILKISPKLVPAYNNLGQLYYLQGELDSAISVLKQA